MFAAWLITFALLFVAKLPAFAEETSCDIRALLQREKLDQPLVELPDGFAFQNPLASTISPNTARVRVRSDEEVQQVFFKIRDMMVKDIGGGKPFEALSPAQRSMITRLQSIHILKIKSCYKGSSSNPEASYDLLTNQVEVCDRVRSAPAIALAAVFGHELGHSIDLANLGCRVYGIHGDAVPMKKTLSPTGVASCPPVVISTLDHSTESVLQSLLIRLASNSGEQRVNECGLETPSEKEMLASLVNNRQASLLDSGVPPLQHPQKKTFQCLANNFHWPTPPSTQEQANQGGYDTYGERSAEVWGAYAVDLYVKQHPKLTTREALGLSQFAPIYKDLKLKGRSSKEETLNQIYLSSPALQHLFGCQADPKQHCLEQFTPSK